MMILRATSILGGQKEDRGMMCSITLDFDPMVILRVTLILGDKKMINE
jgi:hypothetical protein